MIKIIYCLRRLPHLSRGSFHDYWSQIHAPLVRELSEDLAIRRYTQSHGFIDEKLRPMVDARGGIVDMYDGVAELWWNSAESLLAASGTAKGRAAGRRLYDDEKNIIDMRRSPIFFTTEHVIVSRADRSTR